MIKTAKTLYTLLLLFGLLLVLDTRRFGDVFDLTFTYRVDSDFWVPYGTYEEIPFVNLSHQDFSAGKDKLVAWIVRQLRTSTSKTVCSRTAKIYRS